MSSIFSSPYLSNNLGKKGKQNTLFQLKEGVDFHFFI